MLLDIGLGIIIAISVTLAFHIKAGATIFILTILFIFLPDFDFFIELFKHKNVGGKTLREHRQISHYPIIFLPIIILLIILKENIWAWLFGLSILSHFIHDSIGLGWGIEWLWPFNNNFYKLFAKKDNSFSFKNFFVMWEPEELKIAVEKYGKPNWIKEYYLKPGINIFIELTVFIFSIAALYLYYN